MQRLVVVVAFHHIMAICSSMNDCQFLNAPFSGVIAAPGGHSFAYRMMANHTPTHPDGTLTKEVFASWFSVGINKDGSIYGKGMGHEQIPNNWCANTQSPDNKIIKLISNLGIVVRSHTPYHTS